jgi:hypothetical protein
LGVNIAVVEKLLNHTGGSLAGVTGVYQRYEFESEKRTAMQAWANFIRQLITPSANNLVPIHSTQ